MDPQLEIMATMSSTDFSFQNLLLGIYFEFSVAEIT
jgi:hypothetical protein